MIYFVTCKEVTATAKESILRTDRGPEFTSAAFIDWCGAWDIDIQAGRRGQNGFVERFNGSYRYEVLDAYLFDSLTEVRAATEAWVDEYNTLRPHESLGDIPPIEFLNQRGHVEISTYRWI